MSNNYDNLTTTKINNSGDDVNCDLNKKCDPLKLLELLQRLATTTDSIELQIIINKYLEELTQAKYVFLIILSECDDMYITQNHSSREGLIQVCSEKILSKEIRFTVNTSDINPEYNETGLIVTDLDKDFSKIIEMVVGSENNTLIYNIKNPKISKINSGGSFIDNQNISLFVCVAGDSSDTENFEYLVQETFRYVSGHLITAFELFEEKRVRGQCQNLLRVARRLLGKIADLGQLLRGVMAEAKDLAEAERCSLFLIDEYSGELVSKVFDGTEGAREVRIESGKGIAGHVAKTGKLLNIKDAYQHPLFYKGVDELTGFKTRNILCFPICDEDGIIGVAQLCNKLNGFHFDKCDEEIATAFSIYCGISIMHSLVHKKVQKAEARHKLSQELLLYHMKVSDNDIKLLLNDLKNIKENYKNFSSFLFCPRNLIDNNTLRMSIEMFIELNFLKKFKIREDKLVKFLLLVYKGYRDTPYHNFTHAFSVAHFAYCLMKNLKLIDNGILTELQGLSFLIACFCHDLDHRGTNNSYQTESKSSLASLYSSEGSVNERHHLSQAICILNEQDSKILDRLTTEEFKECIDFIRELILATDLAQHFRIFNQLKNINSSNIKENPRLLLSLLITCSDLNDQIKPWPTTFHVADLVYAEFFAQGDLEKEMGIAPNQMMDRQKACIPNLQIEFITTVVRPTFEVLSTIFPETIDLLDIIDDNREHWEEMNTAALETE